jgi:C4-dicarboxylate-specific signal transduction histidine kinase
MWGIGRAIVSSALRHCIHELAALSALSAYWSSKERVQLAALVNSAIEASRPNIRKWGHACTVNLPGAPIHVDAAPTRFQQMLFNLLSSLNTRSP